MKQSVLSAIFMVMAIFGLSTSANAQEFTGTLSNVTMNGKKFNDVPNQKFSLERQSDGYHLVGTVEKIGKMPGTIQINFLVNYDGGFITAIPGIDAGKLVILGGIEITVKLQSLESGNVQNGESIHFVLNTYAGWDKIPLFPASVTFDGWAM